MIMSPALSVGLLYRTCLGNTCQKSETGYESDWEELSVNTCMSAANGVWERLEAKVTRKEDNRQSIRGGHSLVCLRNKVTS